MPQRLQIPVLEELQRAYAECLLCALTSCRITLHPEALKNGTKLAPAASRLSSRHSDSRNERTHERGTRTSFTLRDVRPESLSTWPSRARRIPRGVI